MAELRSEDLTQLLMSWTEGNREALDHLVPIVHAELRRLARRYMHAERLGHTLQTSALVNEAYMRLVDATRVQWQNRAHFFGISARLMRQILVDYARARRGDKRGGEFKAVPLDEARARGPQLDDDLVAVHEALRKLSEMDERKAQVVEMRFFGGLTEAESAEVLKVSPETVRRDWRLAKAWLRRELSTGIAYRE
jgi:RNA polymerase sigma factor (TIGR02999 family)